VPGFKSPRGSGILASYLLPDTGERAIRFSKPRYIALKFPTPRRHQATVGVRTRSPSVPLSHLWVDAGYQGRGKEWVEQELGLRVGVVHRSLKPTPEKVARIWVEEWSKEGRQIDWQRLLPRRGFEVLARRHQRGIYLRGDDPAHGQTVS
jgi:hypothetical protein